MENLLKIYFCFPKIRKFDSPENFISTLVKKSAEEDGRWGGFLGESYLSDALKSKLWGISYKKYTPPRNESLKKIESTIKTAVRKAQDLLPGRHSPLRIFVYPWFPEEGDEMFRGTMGTAFFANTFHLYIDLSDFSEESLKDTTVHEYNHAIYFDYQSSSEETILDGIIMEGLAENFRAAVNGSNPPPWATLIKEENISEHLRKIEKHLDSIHEYGDLYKEIFYGGGEYSRWLGYSLGYRIVNSFIDLHQEVKWNDLIRLESAQILQGSKYQ